MKSFFFGPGAISTLPSLGILFLRLCIGTLMLCLHGWDKLIGFAEKKDSFPDPLGIGAATLPELAGQISLGLTVFAEVGCSVLLILGLFTRLAAFPLAVTMAVATFIVHGADAIPDKELPILYLAVYLSILIAGPGRFSADALIHR